MRSRTRPSSTSRGTPGFSTSPSSATTTARAGRGIDRTLRDHLHGNRRGSARGGFLLSQGLPPEPDRRMIRPPTTRTQLEEDTRCQSPLPFLPAGRSPPDDLASLRRSATSALLIGRDDPLLSLPISSGAPFRVHDDADARVPR